MFQHIACYLPRSNSHCRYLQHCHDIIQHKQAFRTHNNSLLQGTVGTLSDLIQNHRAGFADGSHMCNSFSATAVAINPDLVPSISSLTISMVKLMPKALGESGLGGELVAAAPAQLARLYHPLHIKTILNCLPPISFSRGRLVDLPNTGAAHTLATGYRDITICNAESKPLLGFIRASVSPHMHKSAHAGQHGGGVIRALPQQPTFMLGLILILLF